MLGEKASADNLNLRGFKITCLGIFFLFICPISVPGTCNKSVDETTSLQQKTGFC